MKAIAPLLLVLTVFGGRLLKRPESLAPLIPREVLFANLQRTSPQISGDGSILAYLNPDRKGNLNVVVANPMDALQSQQFVTRGSRSIEHFQWAADSKHILYLQDDDGDEQWVLHSVDVASKEDVVVMGGANSSVEAFWTDRRAPGQVLVAATRPGTNGLSDIYRVWPNRTAQLEVANPGQVHQWVVETTTGKPLRVVAAVAVSGDGQHTMLKRPENAGVDVHLSDWDTWISWQGDDYLAPLGMSLTGSLLVESNINADKVGIFELADGGEMKPVFTPENADLGDVMLDLTSNAVMAVGWDYLRREMHFMDELVDSDLKAFRAQADADEELPMITSRSADDTLWVLKVQSSSRPAQYWLYRTSRAPEHHFRLSPGRSSFLFQDNQMSKIWRTQPAEAVVITAEDGTELPAYVTRPPVGVAYKTTTTTTTTSTFAAQDVSMAMYLGVDTEDDAPANVTGGPLVLLVHGGPWSRDNWPFDPMTQMLANRGYAVLRVNFRGSRGFGKSFERAGDGQWGDGILGDLKAAVSWAVDKQIADPARVAIMGGSFGGYAVLASLAGEDRGSYACGVDMFGPSDVARLIASMKTSKFGSEYDWLERRVGDVSDKVFNQRISPLYHASNITSPLLVAQGVRDPRVPVEQSDEFVKAVRAKGGKVDYVRFESEGHGLEIPGNRLDFYQRVDGFLAQCLGGRAEDKSFVAGTTAHEG